MDHEHKTFVRKLIAVPVPELADRGTKEALPLNHLRSYFYQLKRVIKDGDYQRAVNIIWATSSSLGNYLGSDDDDEAEQIGQDWVDMEEEDG